MSGAPVSAQSKPTQTAARSPRVAQNTTGPLGETPRATCTIRMARKPGTRNIAGSFTQYATQSAPAATAYAVAPRHPIDRAPMTRP